MEEQNIKDTPEQCSRLLEKRVVCNGLDTFGTEHEGRKLRSATSFPRRSATFMCDEEKVDFHDVARQSLKVNRDLAWQRQNHRATVRQPRSSGREVRPERLFECSSSKLPSTQELSLCEAARRLRRERWCTVVQGKIWLKVSG